MVFELDPIFSTEFIAQWTGVNLSFNIVKAHGELIDFQSSKDKGTDFGILLTFISN
jgi:nitrogen-specific signal transduction histidine kinase